MAETGRSLSKTYLLAQLALKALASDVANLVANTRSISTTAPMTGGGDLSQNRTLAVSGATATAQGVVELATDAEVQAATDNGRACTPQGVASRTATETRTGVIELATVAEVATGTDTARASTPAGVKGVADTKLNSNDAKVTADQAVGTASIRTLGTGAQQGAPGNDARLLRPTVTTMTASNRAAGAVTGTQETTQAARIKLDLASMTQTRLATQIATAGQAGTLLKLEYSTDQTTWLDAVTGGLSVSMAALGHIDTGWLTLVAGARIDNCFLRLVTTGWTATPTAIYGTTIVHFK